MHFNEKLNTFEKTEYFSSPVILSTNKKSDTQQRSSRLNLQICSLSAYTTVVAISRRRGERIDENLVLINEFSEEHVPKPKKCQAKSVVAATQYRAIEVRDTILIDTS